MHDLQKGTLMQRVLKYWLAIAALVTAGAVGACSGGSSAIPGGPNLSTQPSGTQAAITAMSTGRDHPGPAVAVCGAVADRFARCHAWRRTDIGNVGDFVQPMNRHTPRPSPTPTPSSSPTPTPTPSPTPTPGNCPNPSISGYQPCDLQTAYQLPSSTTGSGQTVGIVDAYDDPNAESDMSVYRSTFGLPACTTANGCFRKVNQSGVQGSYPRNNTGWAQEISLDLDMASAICPNCHILLVEGSSNSFADLAASENTAVSLGANVVSNSYGGNESSTTVSTYGPDYNHSGVTITASSGDNGFSSTAQFPADLNSVVGVGGTSLTSTSGPVESAWSGAGSGCSGVSNALTAQPSWQTALANITSVCSRRAYADVSAVADPNTGVAVYDTDGASGWLEFGGTSVASPIIASVYALAGNAGTSGPSFPYSHTSSLNDVTTGSNGSCGTDLCNATTGWDGPTGLGTPHGTGSF